MFGVRAVPTVYEGESICTSNQPSPFIAPEKMEGAKTKISDHTLADARELAEWLLYTGNGLYTEVDICTEDGTVKTIRSSAVPSLVGTA